MGDRIPMLRTRKLIYLSLLLKCLAYHASNPVALFSVARSQDLKPDPCHFFTSTELRPTWWHAPHETEDDDEQECSANLLAGGDG